MKVELLVQRLDMHYRLLQEIRQPSRSFVKQFIQILYQLHSNLAVSVTDYLGNVRAIASTAFSLAVVSTPGNVPISFDNTGPYNQYWGDLVGIQVGSNNTAPTANDTAMNTRIAHGKAAGQLWYGGSEIEDPVVAAPNVSVLLRRYFTNLSGGAVTVREVGIHAAGHIAPGAYIFLICRDAIADVVVNNNEILRVQYTPQTTV